MDVAIVVFDGLEELDTIGPYDVFQRATVLDEATTTSLRTVDASDAEKNPLVAARHGLRIEHDGPLDAVDPDLVVVPGGGWNDRADAGAWAEACAGDLPEALARLHEDGSTLASVCTGGMLLAEAGLLDGRPAVTHAGALDDLRASGAEVVDARIVDDGDVVTAGGVTSGIDLALHLVDREVGPDAADDIASDIEYERRGDIHVT